MNALNRTSDMFVPGGVATIKHDVAGVRFGPSTTRSRSITELGAPTLGGSTPLNSTMTGASWSVASPTLIPKKVTPRTYNHSPLKVVNSDAKSVNSDPVKFNEFTPVAPRPSGSETDNA
ncbi:MAG: hypothetical protein ACKOA6_08000 [Actinomycetota bacterium]